MCARVGDIRRSGVVRFGLAGGLLTLGRVEDSLARYDEILKLGQDHGDRVLQVAGCIRGVPLLYLGRLRESLAALRAGLALSLPTDDYFADGFTEEFTVTLRLWLSWALWLRGESDEAHGMAEAAVALARERDPFTLSSALIWAGAVTKLSGDLRGTGMLAAEACALAKLHRYELLESVSSMLVTTAQGLLGDTRQAAAAADTFVEAFGRMGTSGNRSGAGLILGFLAEVQLRAERPADAAKTIELALALSPDTGRFFDAWLLGLRAEIALGRGEIEEAAADLDAAVTLAMEQGALSLERRARAVISRLPAR